MGVVSERQGQGLGHQLMRAAEAYAIEQSARMLTVKTVSEASDNQPYARTRRLYRSVGFFPLEEFPTLWGERNPCVLMGKIL